MVKGSSGVEYGSVLQIQQDPSPQRIFVTTGDTSTSRHDVHWHTIMTLSTTKHTLVRSIKLLDSICYVGRGLHGVDNCFFPSCDREMVSFILDFYRRRPDAGKSSNKGQLRIHLNANVYCYKPLGLRSYRQ